MNNKYMIEAQTQQCRKAYANSTQPTIHIPKDRNLESRMWNSWPFSYQMFMKVSPTDLITYRYGVKKRILLFKTLPAKLDGIDGWVLQIASLNVIFVGHLWSTGWKNTCLVWCGTTKRFWKRRSKVGMCKEKNYTIVCCWSRSAECCSSLKSGILSAWQEHKGWHLP